ncbi:MAG: SDR family oxidoreductase [Gemmatimonas sp.]|jgi:NAD(P)-dependent dehydrogenase (short-subunit alcohol dehydrogenase family)|uniref:SDR family NAD(P)-dependent oxidoreductase n=1 Tax=Gemmatimonas sp. TaxID=1962908 RepID=UPI0031C856C5|nr:SDR family oxidoreductase [Gemmatimonas sp.]
MSFNPFSLAGRRILVTGASSGIGRQIAISCADMGAAVVITGRDPTRLDDTLGQLVGDGHTAVPADLLETGAIDRVVAASGALNGVVLAAGIAKMVPFRMISQAHLDTVLGLNVHVPLLLIKSLLAKRSLQQGASIVFVGAVASEVGPVATAVYSASKAALLGAARTLALEVAKHKMRANVLSPGYVRTPLLDALGNTGAKIDALLDITPLGMGEPVDVAHAAVFLLSDASRWVTRSLFIADGGLTTRMSV